MTQLALSAGKVLGFILSAAAIAVFGYICTEALSGTNVQELTSRHWSALLAAVAVYGLAYVPMTSAWIMLARASGARASPLNLTRSLLVSQIGKYLPGNIAQFLGRAYMARRYGVSFASSGLAIALELAGVLAASGVLAIVAISFGTVAPHPSGWNLPWIAIVIGIAAVAASAWLIRARKLQLKVLAEPLIWGFCLYLLVLSLLALANAILIAAVGGDNSLSTAAKVGGAFLVSWLVGFITPGSPAGLGLRELTFFGLLAAAIPHETLLITAAAFRMITIVGDVFAFLVGLLLPGQKERPHVPEPLPL